ncbi:hypothetical protein GV828_02465 [Flavobacterium sp. NST-5]|uniref:Uncharacterized protein n=1 Tax=Flavobacterium ichthyis TaxID=2698827 RepID=A0ABW9Z5D7_9FLAO|nr:hypothetical protein [Flavobacterium ichthyis]NBL64060.1 hypothetical protein [Flavobacterium ichthyis]
MLENINFTLVSRADSPQGQATNKEQLHTSKYDFGSEPHPNGSLISVQSVLTDETNNSYERQEQIILHFEQTTYIEFDNDFLAKFIQFSIKKHSYDLGLAEDKVQLPSVESILSFVENS